MRCPACGADNAGGARFCSACGNTLSTGGDQRRVATVVFGDLVGFTSLSERRDPEEVKALVDRCFERLAADVVAYGGRVDKIMGDAMVALFGAPVAHEDDPERAVRAALQMQATLATLAADLGGAAMRIGVNTGEVLVGAVRVGDDYTAMGDVVNTASRLQTAARPGEVLVGADTHAATVDVIRYGERREVDAKGKEDTVAAWVALDAPNRPGRRRRPRGRVVGRPAEQALLHATLHLAERHHRTQVVVLTGEAGVGKSRLAEDLAEVAAGHDAFVLEGRCVPYGTANVWFPIAEALQRATGVTADDDVAAVEAKCRDTIGAVLGVDVEDEERCAAIESATQVFLYLMGDESAMSAVDPVRLRDDIVVTLADVLGRVAETRPVVVVLSDVHWADDRVLDLVDRLTGQLSHHPLVTVLTARPEITDRWRPTSGRHNVVELHLDPLGPGEASDLLDELTDGTELPARVRAQLLDRAGGNPLFLEELVALLLDPVREAASPVRALPTDDLPATLRGLVAARIDALSPTTRAAVEDAAVIGSEGPLEALADLAASRSDTDRGGAIRELVDRDLLDVFADGFEFRSDLVREVAYATLTRAERARRHARVASWLERRAGAHGRTDEVLDQLAHHWGCAAELSTGLGEIAGVPGDVVMSALHALERAANRAHDQDEPLIVVELLDRALRLLPADDTVNRWRALIGRAHARSSLHDLGPALADVDIVLAEAPGSDQSRLLVKARVVRGEVLTLSARHEESAEELQRAVQDARELGDDALVAEALRALGGNDLRRNALAEAEPPIREALALFRATGDRRGEAWALQNLAWIAFMSGDAERADERLTKAKATFSEIGDAGGEGWALGLLAWVRFQQGRLDEAERLALKVIPRAESRGERWPLAILTVLLGQVALWQGRSELAVVRAREALAAFEEMGDSYGLIQSLGVLMRARAASGAVADAWQAHARLAEMATSDTGLVQLAAGNELSLATYLGDPARVSKVVEELRDGWIADSPFAGERHVAGGLGLLQMGHPVEAMEMLAVADAAASGQGLRSFLAAPLALARASTGDPLAGLDAAEGALDRGTYLDRIQARLAAAVCTAALDRTAEARAHLNEARKAAAATDDRIVGGIVAVAAGVIEGGPRDEALAPLAELGVDGSGWWTAFSGVLTPAATAPGV